MKQRAAQPPLRNGAKKVASVAHLGGLTPPPPPHARYEADGPFRGRVHADSRVRCFGVYVSQAWRGDLEHAIGPVMSWVIPLLLAYIPAC